jgi:glycine cleavage system aminomethyltransferase T
VFKERLLSIRLLEPEPLLIHHEIVLRNGKPVGNVRAASYGHTLGTAVGLAMVSAGESGSVDAAWLKEGKWEVDIAGRIYPAELSLRPFYDPNMERIKA